MRSNVNNEIILIGILHRELGDGSRTHVTSASNSATDFTVYAGKSITLSADEYKIDIFGMVTNNGIISRFLSV